MKKIRCPYCHSLVCKTRMTGHVEAGKWMQQKQSFEVEEAVTQVVCTQCEQTFYINDAGDKSRNTRDKGLGVQ